MVELSHHDRTIKVKIVYYGPPVGGKTTNLLVLHRHADAARRGEMVSVNSAQDRTILFDLLPLKTPGFRGFDLRLQLLAVPGQAMYAATRRLVLKGADAVVFVANSAADRWEENLQSYREMTQNLLTHHLDPSTLPFVFQYNKRDLPQVSDTELMDRGLNGRKADAILAVAVSGEGVLETFSAILHRTMQDLARRYSILDRNDGQPAWQWTQAAVLGLFGSTSIAEETLSEEDLAPPSRSVSMRPVPPFVSSASTTSDGVPPPAGAGLPKLESARSVPGLTLGASGATLDAPSTPEQPGLTGIAEATDTTLKIPAVVAPSGISAAPAPSMDGAPSAPMAFSLGTSVDGSTRVLPSDSMTPPRSVTLPMGDPSAAGEASAKPVVRAPQGEPSLTAESGAGEHQAGYLIAEPSAALRSAFGSSEPEPSGLGMLYFEDDLADEPVARAGEPAASITSNVSPPAHAAPDSAEPTAPWADFDDGSTEEARKPQPMAFEGVADKVRPHTVVRVTPQPTDSLLSLSEEKASSTLVESYAEASAQLGAALSDMREERDLALDRLEDLRRAVEAARGIAAGDPLAAAAGPILQRMSGAVESAHASLLVPQSEGGFDAVALRGFLRDPVLASPAALTTLEEALGDSGAPVVLEAATVPAIAAAIERGDPAFDAVVSIPLRTPRGLFGLALLYLTPDAARPGTAALTHLVELGRSVAISLELATALDHVRQSRASVGDGTGGLGLAPRPRGPRGLARRASQSLGTDAAQARCAGLVPGGFHPLRSLPLVGARGGPLPHRLLARRDPA